MYQFSKISKTIIITIILARLEKTIMDYIYNYNLKKKFAKKYNKLPINKLKNKFIY